MSFVDTLNLTCWAGRGGDGAVHFRREKFRPKGGPDGGDGGRGGSIVIVSSTHYQTLGHLAGQKKYQAESGQPGGVNRRSGRAGTEIRLAVPLGTEIIDQNNDRLLADLKKDGERFVAAKGGRGGRGNWHFRSATNQTPKEHEDGVAGQQRKLRLRLKLIADVGLIGQPNAGKSTLLNVLTGARSKVGGYAFTTTKPHLGVLVIGGRAVIVADIPGLIEGAAAGKGLGYQFLQHIERTRLLLHLVAVDTADPLLEYQQVRQELFTYSRELAAKPTVVLLTKTDLLSASKVKKITSQFANQQLPTLAISALTNHNLRGLGQIILQTLDSIK